MKGVLLNLDAALQVLDIAHEVPAQSVPQGAATLAGACPWFPRGTVHVGVVDPGVGTERAPITVLAGGHAFVGPDNGLFTTVAQRLGGVEDAYRIDPGGALAAFVSPSPSATFHGRDLFAPTAAALASGRVAPAQVGPRHEPRVVVPPAPRSDAEGVHGVVTHVDHFGNAVTNVAGRDLADRPDHGARCVEVAGRRLEWVTTYGSVAPGGACALLGSDGFLEIAIRDGDAATTLELAEGTPVLVRRVDAA